LPQPPVVEKGLTDSIKNFLMGLLSFIAGLKNNINLGDLEPVLNRTTNVLNHLTNSGGH